MNKYSIIWLRRDLRLEDNAALYYALKADVPVKPIFIFDANILTKLGNKSDARLTFLHDTITALDKQLQGLNTRLTVYHGTPEEVFSTLANDDNLVAVYTNRDYESYALQRDAAVRDMLASKGKSFHTYKDHVIFERGEVTKKDGTPYTVFTPYKKKWLAKLQEIPSADLGKSYYFKSYPCHKYLSNFYPMTTSSIPTLASLGFERTDIEIPSKEVAQSIIKSYDETRDFPAKNGTSKLGIHFRFGTISIREKARKALRLNATYLSELIWRDFYSMILQNFPHVENQSFRPVYDNIEWRDAADDFQAWCEGRTGFPIVDAGMRELNATGYMHNRVRMITASFLTKHLLIDWRKGERYFAEKLIDYDLASNSGGWQWAAGCGTDAAPYFRIFNPYTQADKFDKERRYIRKWVPEVDTAQYPKPIVEHKFARERCLSVYKVGLGKA